MTHQNMALGGRLAALIGLVGLVACIESQRPSFPEVETDTQIADTEPPPEIIGCDGCVVASACRDDGEENPINRCEVCDIRRSTTAWSPVLEAKSCNDGDDCTGPDMCDRGACVAGPVTGCAVTAACVAGCDAECRLTVLPGQCYIDGACFPNGGALLDDACRVCDPVRSQLAWSHTESRCDDGDPCTDEDTCSSGVCAGTADSCDDGFACTSDFCDGGVCQHPITTGCLIEGACYPAGGLAGRACNVCNPNVSRTAFSFDIGNSCEDGLACTTSSTCNADGVCVGTVTSLDDEPNDTVGNAQDVGTANRGVFPTAVTEGNLSVPDSDFFRWPMRNQDLGLALSPQASVVMAAAAPVRLCVYAQCGVSTIEFAAPIVTCPPNTERSAIDGTVVGCCRSFSATESPDIGITAVCLNTSELGFGYAQVQPIDQVDVASCGAYALSWGVKQ